MLIKLLNIVLFWRRNHLPSIVFKTLTWAFLAWLAVGIFTSFRTALIAGCAAGIVAALRYTLRNRKEHARLLVAADGDPQKLAGIKKMMNEKGIAGSFMTELIRDGLHDDDPEDEPVEIDEETRAANIAQLKEKTSRLSELCVQGGYLSAEDSKEAAEALLEEYADGEYACSTESYIEAFLPDNIVSFIDEDFCNDDDHAGLVEEFAQATNGNWKIDQCHSHHDEDSDKWLVSFTENGSQKTWRFSQAGDRLNLKFVEQLVAYVQRQSGYTITQLDQEDFPLYACLPQNIHALLLDTSHKNKAA